VCFQIDCVENPRSEDHAFFTAMSNFAAGEGIRLMLRVVRGGEGWRDSNTEETR
jgi:hypothetical protein